MRRTVVPHLIPLLWIGCAEAPEDVDLRVAHVQTAAAGQRVASISLVDGGGVAIAVNKQSGATESPAIQSTGKSSAGDLALAIDTRAPGGVWLPASNVVLGTAKPTVDVVVVADNSGSQADELPIMRDGIAHFAHVILASAHPDRVGLVRVSTQASIISSLVEAEESLAPALEAMFVNRGWTALWDGVRLANELLVSQAVTYQGTEICTLPSAPTIVLFTDGYDNNSADEHDTGQAGDGFDTTLDDLTHLAVNGVPTAVYTVGIGEAIDAPALTALSDATGGRFTTVDHFGALIGALSSAATKLDAQVPVCFVPQSCSHVEARVRVTIGKGKNATTVERIVTLAPAC